MNIVQANKAYHPHLGGVETVVQQLAEGFAARSGVTRSSVIACADSHRTTREWLNGVDITRTATFSRVASLAVSPSYATHLLRHRGDILHIHEPSLVPSAAYLANKLVAKRRYRKLVVWWHSEIVRQRAMRAFYEPLLQQLLRAADAVIVSSPRLIDNSEMLRPHARKCRVVHLGIEPSRFDDDAAPTLRERAEAIRARYDHRPIVLFTGRLVYYKGVQYLAEAMRSLPGAQLVVIGRGRLRPDLDAIAAQGGARIDVIDYLPADELAAMYRACDLFVLPSVEATEAFGIVQLEAMACGKAVVTSDLPTGVTYVNQHGRTGLVVPRRDAAALAQAMRTLLDDPDRRAEMGEYARARVRREFTVAGMVERTLSIYEELLAK